MGEEIEVVLPTVTWDKSSETRDGFKRRVMAAVEVAVSEGESRAVADSMAARRADSQQFNVSGRTIYRPVGVTDTKWHRFERVVIQGRTYGDVAVEDGVARGNVATRVKQVLVAIIEDLMERGEPSEEVGATLLAIGKHVQADVWRELAKIDQSIFPGVQLYTNDYGVTLEAVQWSASDYVTAFRSYLGNETVRGEA